jgi:hypothetical protein
MGRPEGALKSSLSFLERVLMKDIVTPVPPEEVKSVIKKCLESAALVNYTKLSAQARVEGNFIREEIFKILIYHLFMGEISFRKIIFLTISIKWLVV